MLILRTSARTTAIHRFALLATLAVWLSACASNQEPAYRYRVSDDSRRVSILWERELVCPSPDNLAADDGLVVAHDYSANALTALVAENGTDVWSSRLLGENRGGMVIHLDGDTVYTVQPCCVTAYDKATGQQLWTTPLRGGKVLLASSVLSESVWVYFGNLVFELSKTTGSIVSASPPEGLIWVVDGMAIYSHDAGMSAVDTTSGLPVWSTKAAPFDIRAQPLDAGLGYLLVEPDGGEATCLLELRTGRYSWCYDGRYESDIAVDDEGAFGYLVNDSFELIKLELATGATSVIAAFELEPPATEAELPTTLAGIAASSGRIFIQFTTTDQLLALELMD